MNRNILFLNLLIFCFSFSLIAQDFSSADGHWTFDDSNNLLKAAKGNDLVLTGSHSSVAGPDVNDKAVRIGLGSYYNVSHSASPSNGETKVNRYSIVFDVKIPAHGVWYCLHQADVTNADDAEAYINTDGTLGQGTYSTSSLQTNEWYRVTLTVDNSTERKYYIGGQLVHTIVGAGIDGRHGLGSNLLLFIDAGAYDNVFDISRVAVYNKVLSAGEVAALGGFARKSYGSRYGTAYGWLKGNTHTHVDEQTNPTTAITQYHNNNYDFVVMTEHRSWFDKSSVNIPDIRPDLLIIPGEEFHSNTAGYGGHTTIMNSTEQLGDLPGASSSWSDFWNDVGALAATKNGNIIINHPFWRTNLTIEEFNKVTSTHLFEMFNGAQDASFDNYGIVTSATPMEKRWDDALSLGNKWYGVGSDDAHNFSNLGTVNPFSGWSMIRSTELSVDSIWHAYVTGDFYASNAVILKTFTTDFGLIKMEVDTVSTIFEALRRDTLQWDNSSAPEGTLDLGFQIIFIGENGSVLKTVDGITGEYQATKNDPYVRARVSYTRPILPGGAPRAWNDVNTYITNNNITKETYYAWTQPFFTDVRHEGGIPKFGCTDQAYLEYDATANIQDASACITTSVQIKTLPLDIFNNSNGLIINVSQEMGNYSIEIRDVRGILVNSIKPNVERRHKIKGLNPYSTYFVQVIGERSSAVKKIMFR